MTYGLSQRPSRLDIPRHIVPATSQQQEVLPPMRRNHASTCTLHYFRVFFGNFLAIHQRTGNANNSEQQQTYLRLCDETGLKLKRPVLIRFVQVEPNAWPPLGCHMLVSELAQHAEDQPSQSHVRICTILRKMCACLPKQMSCTRIGTCASQITV